MVLKLTELWNKYFDLIYVILSVYNPLCKSRIESELERVGITQTGKVRYEYAIKSKVKDNIYKAYIEKYRLAPRPNMYDAYFQHYKIMNQSIYLNYNRILIIECDAVFLKDLNKIYTILLNFPEDYNAVLFDAQNEHIDDYNMENLEYINDNYGGYMNRSRNNYSAVLYSVDNRWMRYIVTMQDEYGINACDGVLTSNIELYKELKLKGCVNVDHMVIQNPALDVHATIAHDKTYLDMGIKFEDYNISEEDMHYYKEFRKIHPSIYNI